MVMKLWSRTEGTMILKAIEYKNEITSDRDTYLIGRFSGLVEAIAEELGSTRKDVLRMMENIERYM